MADDSKEASDDQPEGPRDSTLKVFDSSRRFRIKLITVRKSCLVRFPDDNEWAERCRRVRLVDVSRGRRKSQQHTEGVEAAESALFDRIRFEEVDAPVDDFDDAERCEVIDRLTLADVVDAEVDNYTAVEVTLAVVGGVDTVHRLTMPSARLKRDFERDSSDVNQEGRRTIYRANTGVVGGYYGQLFVSATGYAEGTKPPLCHKIAVVNELTALLAELEASSDPLHP